MLTARANRCSDEDIFAPMAVDAMLAVKTINMRGDIKYPVKAVNVLKAHGKSARESMFVQGYALNCTVASEGTSIPSQCCIQVILMVVPKCSHEEADRERKNCLSGYKSSKGAHAAWHTDPRR